MQTVDALGLRQNHRADLAGADQSNPYWSSARSTSREQGVKIHDFVPPTVGCPSRAASPTACRLWSWGIPMISPRLVGGRLPRHRVGRTLEARRAKNHREFRSDRLDALQGLIAFGAPDLSLVLQPREKGFNLAEPQMIARTGCPLGGEREGGWIAQRTNESTALQFGPHHQVALQRDAEAGSRGVDRHMRSIEQNATPALGRLYPSK